MQISAKVDRDWWEASTFAPHSCSTKSDVDDVGR